MYNYKLRLQYDGGRYDGWQRLGKDESTNTVLCKLEEILHKFTGEQVEIFCGSRTEKGVHAYGQTANFKLNTSQDCVELKNYFNRYLPRDIAVLQVEEADERFHSQLNAKERTYLYRIDTGKVANVFERKYSYHTFHKLDLDKMNEAAQYFLGSHDFKTFTSARKSKSTQREVYSIKITQNDSGIVEIRITANDFLHNMARLMFGTLIDVGQGLKKPDSVRAILAGEDVQMSLPAESFGLFLEEVRY
jgi:tRNA pseudouridine38-40 synthase